MELLVGIVRGLRMPVAVTILIVVGTASRLLAQATGMPPVPLSGRDASAGTAVVTQRAVPGLAASVNTLNPSVQVQGAATGSTRSTGTKPFSGVLTLRDAIDRGLAYNMSAVGLAHAVRQAQSQQTVARSALLPNLVGYLSDAQQVVDIAAAGVQFDVPIPDFTLPEVVGPFNVLDLRARLSQTIVGLTALNNYRAARETVRATQFTAQDSRDLIVLAVGGAYLQALAAKARLQAVQAQIDTTTALFSRVSQQQSAGLAATVDMNRAQIQMLTEQQRLVSLKADFAKQKIALARMTGIPPTDQYDLATDVPFAAGPPLTVDQALIRAAEGRLDLKAAEAQVQVAERSLAAAQALRLPSLNLTADYGGSHAASTHATYSVVATVRVPIWEGARAQGEIEQARAVVAQRQAELEDLKAQIEGEVRTAYLDLQAADGQVTLAQTNLRISNDNLGLTRQSFDAGLSDNVAVVQAQERVAAAELDYVNSVFSHNLAKLTLARVVGRAAEALPQFLSLP